MAAPLANLRYSLTPSHIDHILDHSLTQQQILTDVEIGTTSTDYRPFRLAVHSLALASCSPQLAKVFAEESSSFAEGNFLLLFPEWEESCIHALIIFLYRGHVYGNRSECLNLQNLLNALGIHSLNPARTVEGPSDGDNLPVPEELTWMCDPLSINCDINLSETEPFPESSLHKSFMVGKGETESQSEHFLSQNEMFRNSCDIPLFALLKGTRGIHKIDTKENIRRIASSTFPKVPPVVVKNGKKMLKKRRGRPPGSKKEKKPRDPALKREKRVPPPIPDYVEVLPHNPVGVDDIRGMFTESTNAENGRAFSCRLCSKTWSGLRIIQPVKNHIYATHLKVRRYKCKVCMTYSSYTLAAIQEHHARMHTNPADSSSLLKCSHCAYVSTKACRLKRHMQRHSTEYNFKCTSDGCMFAARTQNMLENHMFVHTGGKPHRCGNCSFASTSNGTLQAHIRRVHLKLRPFKCDFCSRNFTTKAILSHHMQAVHSAEKQFLCDQCDLKFPTAIQLVRHKESMHTERPLKCDMCSYSAVYPAILERHINAVHLKTKDFKCDYCSYSASMRYKIQTHMITHTGEKPFACRFCSYVSSRKTSVRRHETIHTGEKRVRSKPKLHLLQGAVR